MTTFKKFVHAKENIDEKGGFPKTMNKNYIIRQELVAVNEIFTAGAATKGGEIDAALGAVAGAGALMAKALYNGVIYAKLKGQLPGYLKQYKEFGAPKSEDVYKATQDRLIQKLKQQKAILTGSGGTRSDNQNSKQEESAKDKIEKIFKAKSEAAPNNEVRSNIKKQKEAALEKIDLQIQKLSKAIEEAENNSDVKWEKAQEVWRQTDDAFSKKQDAFSTAGGLLGSAWKNKWSKEFTIAKNNAKIDVLELAKKIATDKKNDDEVAAISKSIDRANAAEKAAEESLKGIEDDADKADRMQADAGQFGVDAFVGSAHEYQSIIDKAYEKWDSKFEGVEKPGSEPEDAAIDKDKIQAKIDNLNSKISKVKAIIDKKKDSTDEKDKALVIKGEKMVTQLEDDIKAEKAKLSNPSESIDDLYSMQIRLNETNIMLNKLIVSLGLLEAEGEESSSPGEGEHATFSQLRAIINKVIAKTPDDKKQDIASEAAEDIAKVKAGKVAMNTARNTMASKFEDNADKEGDEKLHLPSELEHFKTLKAIDVNDGVEMMDKYAAELKDDHGADVKEEPKTTSDDDNSNDSDNGSNDTSNDTSMPSASDKSKEEQDKFDIEDEGRRKVISNMDDQIKKDTESVKNLKDEITKLTDDKEKSTDPNAIDKKITDKQDLINSMEEDLKSAKIKRNKLHAEAEKLADDFNSKAEESVEPEEVVNPKDDEEDDDLEDTTDDSPAVSTPTRFMTFEDYIKNNKK